MMFYGAIALGVFGSMGGLGEVAQDTQTQGQLSRERKSLSTHGREQVKDSRAALELAKTCTPVIDTATGLPFILEPGMRFTRPVTGEVILNDATVCSELGWIGITQDGVVTEVIVIAAEHKQQFAEIFETVKAGSIYAHNDNQQGN